MGGSPFYYCNVQSMRIDERIEGLLHVFGGTGGWWMRNKEREQQNRKHCDYIGKCFYSPFKHQTRAALMGHQGCLVVHNNNHNSVWAWTGTDTGRGGNGKTMHDTMMDLSPHHPHQHQHHHRRRHLVEQCNEENHSNS